MVVVLKWCGWSLSMSITLTGLLASSYSLVISSSRRHIWEAVMWTITYLIWNYRNKWVSRTTLFKIRFLLFNTSGSFEFPSGQLFLYIMVGVVWRVWLSWPVWVSYFRVLFCFVLVLALFWLLFLGAFCFLQNVIPSLFLFFGRLSWARPRLIPTNYSCKTSASIRYSHKITLQKKSYKVLESSKTLTSKFSYNPLIHICIFSYSQKHWLRQNST